ncbi:MAG: hypothetical protein ACRD2O_07635 [Terriglobia bacterium]
MSVMPYICGSVVPVRTGVDLAIPWLMSARPDHETSHSAGNKSALVTKHVVANGETPATTPGGQELTVMEFVYWLALLGVYLYGVWVPRAKL